MPVSCKRLLPPEVQRSDTIKARFSVSYDENKLLFAQSILSSECIVCDAPKSHSGIELWDDKKLWQDAIKEETNSLILNKTWTLVNRSDGEIIVNCKWVFTIKVHEFGNSFKYKARLVTRHFSQQFLSDYNKTLALVARIGSFRFILAFANQFNLIIIIIIIFIMTIVYT